MPQYPRLPFFLLFFVVSISCTQPEPINYALKYAEAELVWSDEFDGTEVDTTKWIFEEGDHGWGNRELQNYTPFGAGNTSVSDGKLHIIAKKTGENQNYTSARLNSKESFLYGRMEIRAKMPDYKGPGLWPALWMLGEEFRNGGGWPASGEIDIMEYISRVPDSVLVTIHTNANNHINRTQVSSGFVPLPTIEEEFHNYGIILEEDVLHFYIDDLDNILLTFKRPENYNNDNWPFDKPFYFLLNIAVGGTLGGENIDDSIFPATMEIDYVRVWQLTNEL
ncbi:MAG: glycoside hydrolase family 16 protein [Balneolales bacterium]|nr:glycoside hydrolase family 16 protein [Balneolales bacterium]